MALMRPLLDDVLAKIRPSGKEMKQELAFSKSLVHTIQKHVPAGCTVVLTGSMAKRTFLRDKKDVDVFVLFRTSTPKTQLEPSIVKIMRSAFPKIKYQLSYAEHPYVRFNIEGRRVDLVPAYRISDASQRLSAVDRSVLHTKYVLSSLNKKQIDDVLLLKQFLRSNSLYGAEIKIAGFSGYLCELLIIKHGSFQKLIQTAARWPAEVFIDLEKYYPKSALSGLHKRFGFFVVIDPTDKNRNVAAAVSEESIKRFMAACRKFRKNPSTGFFFKKPVSFEEKVKKASRGRNLLLVSLPRPNIVDEVLWGQIYRLCGQLEMQLKGFGPKILADDAGMIRLAIILKNSKLPAKKLQEGPPVEMEEHVRQFKKSHKGAKFLIRGKKIFAVVKCEPLSAKQVVMEFFKKFSTAKSHLAYPITKITLT